MATHKNTRTARIIRQRRKHRLQRGGNASKVAGWLGCSFGTVVVASILSVVGALASLVLIYGAYARRLPPPEAIVSAQAETFQTSIFYDRTGTFKIYEVIDPNGGDRQYVTLNEVPQYFLDATIAIEDARFYENPGFDVEGILRSAWINLTSDNTIVQGGSTITQQLVRNQLLSAEERNARTVDRKLKEIILAGELSRLYSKDQILEWYINTSFYGNLAYGVEAAARVYFDKSAHDLTLGEAAMLAAIPQNPALNPLDDRIAAAERQRIVLREMVRLDYITQADMDAATQEVIILKPFALRFDITAPHFALYARNEAETILDTLGYDGTDMILRRGLKIYTALDLDVQRQLECLARTQTTRLAGGDPNFVHNTSVGTPCVAAEFLPALATGDAGENRTVTNAAGVILKANTGEIVAMLGSVDFWNEGIGGEFNASLAQRQPASTFKPFVYVTAFINPINDTTVVTPATMTYDVLTEFNNSGTPYIPQNIDRQFHGPISVRQALARSYNVPVVQVLDWVGLSEVLRIAHRMGINSMNDSISAYGLSLALGSAEASLLDMTYAYNVLNNNGVMVGAPVPSIEARDGYRQFNPVSVLRIEDANGEILWAYGQEYGTFNQRTVLEPGIAYMMTDILSDNSARYPAFPLGSALELSRPAAAKTGTSDDFRDSWTIGYTPQYTVGIWVGNNDNASMTDVTGVMGAAPIWHGIMEYIHTKDTLPIEVWAQPDTVIRQNVCQISGLLPNSICPTQSEIFYYNPARGIDYRPNRTDTYWVVKSVNTCNNTLAVPYSPADCVSEKQYFEYPEALLEWAIENGADLPPTVYDVGDSATPFSRVAILSPGLLEPVSGTIDIRGNARDDAFDYFRLEFGAGVNPTSWQQIGTNEGEGGGDVLLGTWNTAQVPDGPYTLRLTLVRTDRTTEIANREIIVDNTPPRVRLLQPVADQTLSAGQDVFVRWSAEPADNRQIDYVDFYLDGELMGRATESPYEYLWEITREGPASVWAVVYDKAGNRAESERVNISLTR
ncbi:MAG: transglycosylase domain-containing protein [Anaerolineales bacterium]|nr:transglycosylase domain-containing protein [Anaerolineales bacterium]